MLGKEHPGVEIVDAENPEEMALVGDFAEVATLGECHSALAKLLAHRRGHIHGLNGLAERLLRCENVVDIMGVGKTRGEPHGTRNSSVGAYKKKYGCSQNPVEPIAAFAPE